MATPLTQVEPAVVEEQALQIVRELLLELGSRNAAEKVSLDSSLDRDLGLGSLERVELLVRFESKFDVQLADETAQEAETPADWIQAVLNGGGVPATKSRYHIVPPARPAPPAPGSASSLVEVLRRHTETEPDRIQIHLPEDDRGQDITYRELLEAASEVAAGLAAHGLARNETVAIMLPTCGDFFFAFLGVQLAGAIPVPIYPPARPDKIEEYVRRQTRILANAEVRFLITFDRVKAVSQLMLVSLPSLAAVTSVSALRSESGRRTAPAVEPSATAFIQYTSGSTGDPKGVVLSHANILANVQGIGNAVQVRPVDVVVSWLPLYHDMGLIGAWLFSLFYALPITVLSPLAFLSRPERWLWAMHDARGTLCPAPNFSYELCARKIPDRAVEGLDLSQWRVAINAGEAVLPETIARFSARFAKHGFRAESMLPCYGLAESSVALAFPPIDRLPKIDRIRREPFETEGRAEPEEAPEAGCRDPNILRFVSAGKAMPQHEIRIVDEKGNKVSERVRGRLLFRGPSQTAGYYRNPKATEAVFDSGGWMDSGDLAYWADGELFITGRLKDCIIKSGRNIVPQEVEEAAAEVEGVRRGCVAAFGVADEQTGTERLVVVAETRKSSAAELRRIEAQIVEKVDAAIGIPPDKVALVGPQSIPKTSSGKIRRFETRSLFLSGALEAGKQPPWLQIIRLWLGHAGGGLRLVAGRLGRWCAKGYRTTLLYTTAAASGFAIHLLPRRVAGRFFRLAAKLFLRTSAYEVEVSGESYVARGQPCLFLANRAGRLDPLVLAACLPGGFLFADSAAFDGLPQAVGRWLRPLAVRASQDRAGHPGGRLRQRIQKALDEGASVLVFPEARIGAEPHRSSFRLDAFHAAVATSCLVYPVGVTGTSHMMTGHPALRRKARIVIGEAIRAQVHDRREIVLLRERVREAIGKNCQ